MPSRLVLAALAAALAVGCGGGPPAVVVTGRLVLDGRPYPPDPDEVLVVLFEQAGEAKLPQSHPAAVAPDGTFAVRGPDRRGIPPGPYRIVVSVTTSGDAGVAPKDRLRGRFEKGKTPLAVEVPDAPAHRLTIDLTKGAVTAE